MAACSCSLPANIRGSHWAPAAAAGPFSCLINFSSSHRAQWNDSWRVCGMKTSCSPCTHWQQVSSLIQANRHPASETTGPFVLIIGKMLFGTILEVVISSFSINPKGLPYPKLIRYKEASPKDLIWHASPKRQSFSQISWWKTWFWLNT